MNISMEKPELRETDHQSESCYSDSELLHTEKKEYDRNRMTEILTGSDAHLHVLRLAKEGVLSEKLPEVDNLRGVRHTLEGHKANFHREGDVFRHTLNVIRAINLPEVQELIKEIHPELAKDDDLVQSFFDKTGPELAWSLLLHDIGKKQTQAEAVDEDDKPIGYYSFRGHGSESAKIFLESIAPRFNLPPEQAMKTATLIKDHMIMHKLMRGKGALSDTDQIKIMEHPEKGELLWHAFFDSIGNYTGDEGSQAAAESKEQKIADFRAALEALQEYDYAKEAEAA